MCSKSANFGSSVFSFVTVSLFVFFFLAVGAFFFPSPALKLLRFSFLFIFSRHVHLLPSTFTECFFHNLFVLYSNYGLVIFFSFSNLPVSFFLPFVLEDKSSVAKT